MKKAQQYGGKWFVRRVMRELIRPTTRLGQYFKPLAAFSYHLISRPSNFIYRKSTLKAKNNDALYFFYDFEVEPVTYDFVWALSVANAKRIELGLAQLHIVLVPGSHQGLRKELPEYDKILNYDARIWRIHSIILSSIKLLPCSYGVTLCATRKDAALIREQQAKHVYPDYYNVTFPVSYAPELAVQRPETVTLLRADSQAKEYVSRWLNEYAKHKKTIVITLRQYAYTPERNSNIKAWARFAAEINQKDYFVVFVADIEQALQDVPDELKNFVFFNAACWNLNLRSALYELAYLNLGVNTGPMSLCWFNACCRYITFKIAVKNVPQVPLKMITEKGFVPHQNPTFANSFQKWVWEDDDYEVITREFKLMCRKIA